MLIMKFGGTSVASAENIKKVHDIIKSRKTPFIVVVSALGGCTDQLQLAANMALGNAHQPLLDELRQRHLSLIEELLPLKNQSDTMLFVQKHFNQLEELCNSVSVLNELSDQSLARILSFGELFSSYIIYRFLSESFPHLEWMDARELISVSGSPLKSTVNLKQTNKNIQEKCTGSHYLIPGFIASDTSGHTMLLGRGGSDYSAALIANALNAEKLEIWSDVDGMLNANPQIVPKATSIASLSYKEAFELSHFGAKVLYPPTIAPLMEKKIPLHLKNTLNPSHEGTLIHELDEKPDKDYVKGISSLPGIAVLTISGVGMAGIRGTSRRVFSALEMAGVNVILITQCCSEESICIGIYENDGEKAAASLELEFSREIENGVVDPVQLSNDYSILAIVGDNMKNAVGMSGKAFSALGENGINIVAIAQGGSERNISIVIDKTNEKKAVNVLHEKFFGNAPKVVHLFVAGVGNVGKEFLHIVEKQKEKILKHNHIVLRIAGLANSKRFVINEEGIDYTGWQQALIDGEKHSNLNEFVSKMIGLNLRNTMFIDNTASEVVSGHYEGVLGQSISIAACNKIAPSSEYARYQSLLKLARSKNCHLQYETCVGAALPVINTIKSLVLSGDEITEIQAVLSGSLNFIFNNYDATRSFAEIVKQAGVEGYTEPNPLIDLSGVDVMRKILILGRETGHKLEMTDVKAESFLPDECHNAKNKEELYELLEKNEAFFADLYKQASDNNCKLKVIANYQNGQATVSLQQVPADSPFYNLSGKDNIVSIISERYPEQPLIVKGAGAGAKVTASGVFSDVMLTVNN